jgi:hypothetical protein
MTRTIAHFLIAGAALLSTSLIGCKSSPPTRTSTARPSSTYPSPAESSQSAPATEEAQDGLQSNGSLTSYRGAGYTVTFPGNWRTQVAGPTLSLYPNGLPLWFSIGALNASGPGESCRTFHDSIASQFAEPFSFGGSQKSVYGRWQGETLQATAKTADGALIEVACTEIAANNTWYVLTMVVPSKNEWAGYKVRESLADAIQF